MKPIARFSSRLLCGALLQACSLDTGPVSGPSGVVAADVVGEEQPTWGPWSTPINLGPLVNSPADDNRPAISKDGLSLYITSGRMGGFGGLDIWVSQRATVDDPWGPPQNLGSTVNSSSNDVAPAFSPAGHRMYFHSLRPGGCGLADIYVSRRRDTRDDFAWGPPEDLGCVVNTPYVNAGPTIFEDETTGTTTLYFTVQNNPPGSDQGFDIYASTRTGDEGAFGAPVLVPELSSPFRDTRTAIRRDGRGRGCRGGEAAEGKDSRERRDSQERIAAAGRGVRRRHTPGHPAAVSRPPGARAGVIRTAASSLRRSASARGRPRLAWGWEPRWAAPWRCPPGFPSV